MGHIIALLIMAAIAIFATLYMFSDKKDRKHL